MSSFVFTTLGSWGDLFPFVELARELRLRGHSVSVATSPAWAQMVREEGLGFSPTGRRLDFGDYRRHPEILSGRFGSFAGVRNVLTRFVLPQLDTLTTDLRDATDGADLLVAHPAMLAAPIVAELDDTPWATASVFPGLIPSAWTVPQGTPLGPFAGGAGRLANRAAWCLARGVMAATFDRSINQTRVHFGLPRARENFLRSGMSPLASLVLASPRVVPRPPDWPASVELTGFVHWDRPSAWEEPPEFTKFLEQGPPPVVVTLGTSSALHPGTFFRDATGALSRLGRRALVVTGSSPPIELTPGVRTLVQQFVPFSVALPRCHAIVHHAGAGTVVAALIAGIPQLAVPRSFDQPSTAARLANLGVGRVLPWHRLSPARMERELSELLGDSQYRESAEQLARALAAEDGLATISARLEELVATT